MPYLLIGLVRLFLPNVLEATNIHKIYDASRFVIDFLKNEKGM